MIEKVYLGDGVYATFDGDEIILTTENGIIITNTIVLDVQVTAALIIYIKKFRSIETL